MTDTRFTLAEASLVARPSGALWWPEASLLTVSDLHLGRSERIARRGGTLLPPYDTRETLTRLAAEIDALAPRSVICLGDSFDDPMVVPELDEEDRAALGHLMAGRRWIWIAGNHDPSLPDIGGSHMEEVARGTLLFRHIAEPRTTAGEVSGHYHPKMRLPGRGGTARPCFIHDARRLMMPAFGAYTGGLDCATPAVHGLFEADAVCILTGRQTHRVPLSASLPATA